MRIRQYWLIIFLALGTATFFFYQEQQVPLTYHFAEDFDGNDYEHIYNYFTESEDTFKVPFPFHQRILVPYLAAQLDTGDIIRDFQWVNLAFTLLAILVTFSLWRMLGFDLKWIWFGFIWLLFHWSGLIRLNAFDPITVDLPIYAFQGLFLIILFKRKYLHLLWLAPLATSQKESFIGLMIVLILYAWWHNRKTEDGYYDPKILGAALGLSIATQFVIDYYFPASREGKGALITIAYHAKEALLNPFELIRWLAAISMAFGPAIWIAVYQYGKTHRYDNKRNLLVLFSGLYLVYGILAGGDMTRIVFLGFPFILTWIIYELRDCGSQFRLWLLLLSLPLFMLHAHIPDPAWERELWQSWYPEFMGQRMALIILAYVLLITSRLYTKSRPADKASA